MDEEKNMEWLEGQTITIPVEEYIKMRLELASLDDKYTRALNDKWNLDSALSDAKKQIKELLGIDEEEKK